MWLNFSFWNTFGPQIFLEQFIIPDFFGLIFFFGLKLFRNQNFFWNQYLFQHKSKMKITSEMKTTLKMKMILINLLTCKTTCTLLEYTQHWTFNACGIFFLHTKIRIGQQLILFRSTWKMIFLRSSVSPAHSFIDIYHSVMPQYQKRPLSETFPLRVF